MEAIPFSVRHVVDDMLKPLALRAEQKGLELVAHVLPDVPGVAIGDPSRFRQILMNLVGNADQVYGSAGRSWSRSRSRPRVSTMSVAALAP